MHIQQNARVYAGLFSDLERAQLEIGGDRQCYVQVARGAISVNGMAVNAGDGVKLLDVPLLILTQGQNAEVLVFDLPRTEN